MPMYTCADTALLYEREGIFVCLETTAMESLNSILLWIQMTLSLLGVYFYLNVYDICHCFCWIPAPFLTANCTRVTL